MPRENEKRNGKRQQGSGDYPRLRSARDGIDRYLVECTCVGIDVATQEVYAPYGLDDIAAGLLKINARNRRPELFDEKARNYKARWPWLTIASPP